jgi:hypothetical protein
LPKCIRRVFEEVPMSPMSPMRLRRIAFAAIPAALVALLAALLPAPPNGGGSLLPAAHAKSISEATPGSLITLDPEGNPGLCPLKHTDVKASISGFLARVTVTQEFENPFAE